MKTSGNGRCAAGFALCQATNSRGRCGRRDARGTARKRRPSSPVARGCFGRGVPRGSVKQDRRTGKLGLFRFVSRLSLFCAFRPSPLFVFPCLLFFVFHCFFFFLVFPPLSSFLFFALRLSSFPSVFVYLYLVYFFMSVVFSLKVEHSVGTCYFYSNTIFSMIVCFDWE